ncbi:MAG: T9SS type A sorting domain-containing protein [Bacteroidales bacterium]|nr:T9SS type A sorting domain-containing protein [Bacteroidales bacterium]
MLQLISSSGNSAVFRGLANASGPGIIQATVTTPFGVVLTTKYTVWVGVPGIIGITGLSSNLVGGSSTYTAHLTDVRANVTSYNWSLMPGVYNNYFAPNGHTCDIAWYTAGYYALAVNAQNTCGTSSSCYFPISISSRGYLVLSPNPARDNVQVSVTKVQNTSSISGDTSIIPELKTINDQDITTTYTIKIYNTFGIVFYSDVKTGDSFTIPVSNIQEGTYIVEVSDGKNSYSRQLVVKH